MEDMKITSGSISTASVGEYNEDSILDRGERMGLRERPATLLGYTDERGCFHAIMEIVANSIDEARQGFGNIIDIVHNLESGEWRVIDRGRGVPLGMNANGKFNYKLVFCKLYATGKGLGADGGYSVSEGLNGIGCTAANYTSDYLNVTSHRVAADGKLHEYKMQFEEGVPTGEFTDIILGEVSDFSTGTDIVVKPSNKVFTETHVPFDMVVDRLRKKAIVVPGVALRLTYGNEKPVTLYYKDGMYEYVGISVDNPINSEVIAIKGEGTCNDTAEKRPECEYVGSIEIALSFSNEVGEISAYHNGAILSLGGKNKDGLIDGITRVFTKYAKEEGKIAKDAKLNKKDIECLIYSVIESRCPSEFSGYEHQTKDCLANKSIYKLTSALVVSQLYSWGMKNRKEFTDILDRILLNQEIREKGEAIRKNVLKKLTSDTKKLGNGAENLLDCTSNDPEKCEIFFMEGDSASGTISFVRNDTYQAIMPLRGKIPNCLKKSLESILDDDNSIIVKILATFGCGIEIESDAIDLPKFDESKLRYHKIIIATDADVDGGHIITLLLVMIYRFIPSLIRKGYVYVAVSPLYTISKLNAKGDIMETLYAYTDEERDSLVSELIADGISRKNILIVRSKGLGESSDDVISETIMNPKTRWLKQISYPENEEELYLSLNALLGTDIESRRQAISDNFNSVRVEI